MAESGVESADVPSNEVPVVEEAPALPSRYRYHCRLCRSALFTSDEVVPHDTSSDAKGRKPFKERRWAGLDPEVPDCTSLFLDPDVSPWVAEESRSTVATSSTKVTSAAAAVVHPDTIYCPQCQCKIGQQCWSGSQCSCGAWVTPAFKIHSKCVDAMVIADGT